MAFMCTSNDINYAHEIFENNKLVNSPLKFFRPKPSYKIREKDITSPIHKVEYEILSNVSYNINNIPDWINVTLYSINSGKKNSIKIMYIIIENNIQKRLLLKDEEKNRKQKNKVILYSHENGTDLFRILPFLIDLSVQIKCDIISYDYHGFGCSTQKPNEKNFTSIYEKIIDVTINKFKYKIDNILLMGRDIGAIHSIIIASRNKYNNCMGMILISPVISEKIIDSCIMKSIICPTLLIQPKNNNDSNDNQENEVVLFCREINNEKEWFPKDTKDYNSKGLFCDSDIFIKKRKKFISLIRQFMVSNESSEKIYNTGSGISTNSGTSEDNNEINENKDDNDNENRKENKKENSDESEDEGDNNYNNDDY